MLKLKKANPKLQRKVVNANSRCNHLISFLVFDNIWDKFVLNNDSINLNVRDSNLNKLNSTSGCTFLL